jgi:hypothetical protein
MKKKTVTKKLVLNKKTIVHLDRLEMNVIHGGQSVATTPLTECTCITSLCRTTDTDDTQDNC